MQLRTLEDKLWRSRAAQAVWIGAEKQSNGQAENTGGVQRIGDYIRETLSVRLRDATLMALSRDAGSQRDPLRCLRPPRDETDSAEEWRFFVVCSRDLDVGDRASYKGP